MQPPFELLGSVCRHRDLPSCETLDVAQHVDQCFTLDVAHHQQVDVARRPQLALSPRPEDRRCANSRQLGEPALQLGLDAHCAREQLPQRLMQRRIAGRPVALRAPDGLRADDPCVLKSLQLALQRCRRCPRSGGEVPGSEHRVAVAEHDRGQHPGLEV